MKKFLFLLTGVLIIAGLSVNAAPKKVKIEVGCYPALDAAYAAFLPDFNKKYPNIEVTIKALGHGDHHNALTTALAAGEGAGDVEAIDVGFIAQFVASGGTCDLTKAPFNAKQYKKLFNPGNWAQATSDDGKLIAMPVDIAPMVAYYRRDIFDEEKIDIHSIKTMDDLYAAAKKITKDTNGDGKVDRFFIADAANIASMIMRSDKDQMLYFNKKGQPIVDKERFKAAFQWAQKFRKEGLDAGIGAWTNEWYQAFQNGTVAYEPSGAWLGGHLKNWMAPKTAGKWGTVQLPALKKGQHPMAGSWGGSFLAIPEQSKHKKAAWAFVKFACTNEKAQISTFKVADSFPALKSAWKDPIMKEPIPFLANQKARLLWVKIAKEIPVVVTNKYDNVAAAIVGSELASVLNEGKDVNKALADAKAQIAKRIRRG
jgi:multiple sugar transport system substrate-binding protein